MSEPEVIHSFSGKRHYRNPDGPEVVQSWGARKGAPRGTGEYPALCDPNTYGRVTDRAARHEAQWADGRGYRTKPPTDEAIEAARQRLLAQPVCKRCVRKQEALDAEAAKQAEQATQTPASAR